MKKIFFILSITFLFVTKIFGQAQIDIPLIVTDGTININLALGLDLTATNCIDPQLGESDLPPVPPTGMFDVRFDLWPYGCGPVSSYKDYRAPGNTPAFPFTGMIEHTLWWQVSSPGLPINITYNLPAGAIMRINDQIGGVFLNIGPFAGQGVENPSYLGFLETQAEEIGRIARENGALFVVGVDPISLGVSTRPPSTAAISYAAISSPWAST